MIRETVRRIFVGILALGVLAVVPVQTFAATKTWSATPVSGAWSNPANWDGGVAPVNGDDLVFPANSTIKATTNDLNNLAVNSITFNGNGYTIAGLPIVLGAGGVNCTTFTPPQTNTFSVDIALSANTSFNITNGCQIDISGVISGAFGFDKHTGTGVLQLSGANTFSGAVQINAGLLSLAHDQGLGAADGTPATGTTLGVTQAAIALFGTRNVGNEWLSLQGTGGPGGSNFGALYGAGSWAGPIVLAADTRIGATGPGSFTLSNVISGPGGLDKRQDQALVLLGTNTYTGATVVTAGRLLVNGTSASSNTQVASGATLGGSGTILNPVSALAGGTIAPGVNGPAILSTGNLSFSPGSTFTVELNGTTPGTGHDQLNVTGTVALGGATLNVLVGFAAAPNAQFTIINNDGADPVNGTFAGLAQGAQFNVGPSVYSISYTGGTGNDVVLTAVAPVPTMGPWFLLLLALLLTAAVVWQLRRSPRIALP